MTFLAHLLAGVLSAACVASAPAAAATLVTFGDPWGRKNTLETAMDGAFGVGAWADVSSPTGTGFLANERFVYMDGSERTTNEMEAFLGANAPALESWVSRGGALFMNAAPNEGNGLIFAGLRLNYNGSATFCALDCVPTNASHPIFSGIAATSFPGSSFSHATVTGGAPVIENDADGAAILSEVVFGRGHLMMGGMTTTNFHDFREAQDLRQNILSYSADRATDLLPVPLPAGVWMLLAGLGGVAACAFRKTPA